MVAAITVGLVLVAAGAFKLIDGPGWPRTAGDLGVPSELAQLVPFVEIALGAALAAQLVPPWPAVAAIALLVVFTIAIAMRLRDGSRPPCACFGSRSRRPLGAYHLFRNGALIALAVAAAVWA